MSFLIDVSATLTVSSHYKNFKYPRWWFLCWFGMCIFLRTKRDRNKFFLTYVYKYNLSFNFFLVFSSFSFLIVWILFQQYVTQKCNWNNCHIEYPKRSKTCYNTHYTWCKTFSILIRFHRVNFHRSWIVHFKISSEFCD
jgi:hypothetical protein